MRKLAAFAASFSAAVFAWAYGALPLLALLAVPALRRRETSSAICPKQAERPGLLVKNTAKLLLVQGNCSKGRFFLRKRRLAFSSFTPPHHFNLRMMQAGPIADFIALIVSVVLVQKECK